ncbi:MAG: helix-turn-helix domain-containing protein [Myxococcales bacterium]|nr:helix-turn-helix domain-containing protein [Myxococcales bacterium]
MERRTINTGTPAPTSPSRTVGLVDAKMSLSLWLRTGRANKGLSLEAVAKITKIQPRILERLEAGKLDGLPAEVFVRGFVRSFARCVGLDEAEALERYTAAAGQPTAPTAAARALVESMSELAPITATRSPRVLRRDPAESAAASDGEPTFAAGSLQDLPKAETVVEMLLPETGTLVAEPVVEAADRRGCADRSTP